VETRAIERSTSDVVPFADNNPPAINNKWSRVLFNRLTGIPEQGNLVVQANVTQGSVYVDGEVATGLNGGRAQVNGLSEGTHIVAVEADGHGRYETEVTVTAGQTTEIDARLEPMAVQGPGDTDVGGGGGGGGVVRGGGSGRVRAERPGGTARILFWTTVVTTAAGATGAVITGSKVREAEDEKRTAIEMYQMDGTNTLDNADACGAAEMIGGAGVQPIIAACDKGEDNALYTTVFLGATAVSAVAALYFGYVGYVKATPTERRTARAGSKASDDDALVRFAPTITPNYLGAGLTIEF
jgi:hypothetical protein